MIRRLWRRFVRCDHMDGTRRIGHGLGDDVHTHRPRHFFCERCGRKVPQIDLDDDDIARRERLEHRLQSARDTLKREQAEKREREAAKPVPIRRAL